MLIRLRRERRLKSGGGGRTFQFDSKAEALKAGFHLEDPAIIEKPEKR